MYKMMEISKTSNKGKNFVSIAKTGDNEQKVVTILGIFHQIPAATTRFIERLIPLILGTESSLMIEPTCPFRDPLMKFLLRYPNQTIDYLMSDSNVNNKKSNRFVVYLLKHKTGLEFRNVMQTRSNRLTQLIRCNSADGMTAIQRYVTLILLAFGMFTFSASGNS